MLSYLAAPRMAAISRFFHAASDDHQLGAYAWTQAVAAALWPVMGDFEVSLRNAIHRALSLHYGEVESFDWMCQRPNCALSVKAKMLPAWHCMSKRQQTDIEKSREQVKKSIAISKPRFVSSINSSIQMQSLRKSIGISSFLMIPFFSATSNKEHAA